MVIIHIFVLYLSYGNLVCKHPVGFVHGVMNTDNMLISGETIDYGPCAFMDYFDPNTVYSYIDRQGRYAYSNQPSIGNWNLIQLVQPRRRPRSTPRPRRR